MIVMICLYLRSCEERKKLYNRSKENLPSPTERSVNWRMESIVRDSESPSEDEEFFDCQGSHISFMKFHAWSFQCENLGSLSECKDY